MHFSGGQVQPILSGLDSKQLSYITFHFNDSNDDFMIFSMIEHFYYQIQFTN